MKDSSLDEILQTFYEDILVSESELSEGDRKTSLEIVEQAQREAETALQTYITKREREARIDELKELIKPRECYRPSCKQEHTLLRKKYVKDRIKELNTSEGGE